MFSMEILLRTELDYFARGDREMKSRYQQVLWTPDTKALLPWTTHQVGGDFFIRRATNAVFSSVWSIRVVRGAFLDSQLDQ